MADAHATLLQMKADLDQCGQGRMTATALCRRWREAAPALPLPPRFGQVLGGLLDRLEAGALFSEESCSFSQQDLLDSLRLWADLAAAQLPGRPCLT